MNTITGTMLTRAIRQIAGAASRNKTLPHLNGILLENTCDRLQLTACDSYRIAIRTTLPLPGLKQGEKLLIPATVLRDTAQQLQGTGPVTVTATGQNTATFETDGTQITVPLLDSHNYPNLDRYTSLTHPYQYVVARRPLVDSFKWMQSAVGKQAKVRVWFTVYDMEVAGQLGDGDEARFSFPVEKVESTGGGRTPDVETAVNIGFFRAGVEAARTDHVVIQVLDSTSPIVIRSEPEDGYRYVFMPFRK
jgi:DNA polymerase III sliding clamp (beta) subunit (PCNA family)